MGKHILSDYNHKNRHQPLHLDYGLKLMDQYNQIYRTYKNHHQLLHPDYNYLQTYPYIRICQTYKHHHQLLHPDYNYLQIYPYIRICHLLYLLVNKQNYLLPLLPEVDHLLYTNLDQQKKYLSHIM